MNESHSPARAARRPTPDARRARRRSTGPRVVGLAASAAAFVALALACGGKVTFVSGTSSGSGGEGGQGSGNECFIGKCNEPCIKCVGSDCTNGRCDDDGICQPPGVTITCMPPPPG